MTDVATRLRDDHAADDRGEQRHDHFIGDARRPDPFLADVRRGMAQPQKAVPARWFYDHRGSQLFEDITRLPEYYPTRTEIGILQANAASVAESVGRRVVVEFGSGSSRKTPLLLRAIDPVAYVPIDISGDFLRESAAALGTLMPGLDIAPLEGDFTHRLALPPRLAGRPALGFFPGSTIGNLAAPGAVALLDAIGETLGNGSMLLIGIDRTKPLDVLLPAYDDAAGVTAAFNLNLLHRINRELDGDIPVDAFRHEARWNAVESRVEMHLVASRAVRFRIAGRDYHMAAGETIHTENSHKYSREQALLLLRAGGWTPLADWADGAGTFGLYLARRAVPSVQD